MADRMPSCKRIMVDHLTLVLNCTAAVLVNDPSTRGLGFDAVSLAWPAMVQKVVFFISGCQCLQDKSIIIFLVSS